MNDDKLGKTLVLYGFSKMRKSLRATSQIGDEALERREIEARTMSQIWCKLGMEDYPPEFCDVCHLNTYKARMSWDQYDYHILTKHIDAVCHGDETRAETEARREQLGVKLGM